ncbi:6981_t:CDS:2 [Ambispora leptoticha]|uniref:6981_t:CDS:1 n=1 Tax=Ambispora leptoticha TaxID=144679 RepID=A0A9N8YVW1_9GLOM|nr:6981_t:CDS:2 [Ambispora leptoticha]
MNQYRREQVISKQFQQVSSYLEELPAEHALKPTGEDAAHLHALFKQATIGDVIRLPLDKTPKRDLEAWENLKGMTIDEAKAQYVDKSIKWLQLHKDKIKEANELITRLSRITEYNNNDVGSDEEYSSTTAPPSNDSAESLLHVPIDKQQQSTNSSLLQSQNINLSPSLIYSSDNDDDEFEEARNDSSLLPTPSKSTFHDERIAEIEKALERLQAEVSASNERTEALRQDLVEDQIKKQVAKKTWTWWIKIITKHAIINGILLLIGLALFSRASPFAVRIIDRSRVLEIWKYTKRLLIDWKYNYELKR